MKRQITSDIAETALSLPSCRLICSDYASLWPKPTGTFLTDNNRTVQKLNIDNIRIVGYAENTPSTKLFQSAAEVFRNELKVGIIKNIFEFISVIKANHLDILNNVIIN